MNDKNDAEFLLAAAAWQDSLLQSYRSLHLTFQSIILAIGVGLLVAILSFELGLKTFMCAITFLGIWVLQLFATSRFKQVVLARGRDVNFWHRQLIIAEQTLPMPRRYFTRFKVYQKFNREDFSYLEELFPSNHELSQTNLDTLVEKGVGHTRLVIDEQLFQRISLIWGLLLAMILVTVIVKAVALFWLNA